MVKLAVAIRDLISYDSASPGFDSRPMHECTNRNLGDCSFDFCSVSSRGPSVRGWDSAEPRRVGGVGVMWLPWSMGGGNPVNDCHVEWGWK